MRSLQFKPSANLEAPGSGVIIGNNPVQQIEREVLHVTSFTKFLDTREGWLPAGLGSCVKSVPKQLCACLPQHVCRQATPLCAQLCRDAASCSRNWHELLIRDYINPWQNRDDLLTSMGLSIRDLCIFSVLLGTNCTAMLSESEMGNVL